VSTPDRRPLLPAMFGDSVVTGPSVTNVNDFRAIIVDSVNQKVSLQ